MDHEDSSFVKQSLAETLTSSSSNSRLVSKPSVGKSRKINSKEIACRKAKAEEESGGILKSLGLTPAPRKTPKSLEKEDVTDWEEVGNFHDDSMKPFEANSSSYQSKAQPLKVLNPTTQSRSLETANESTMVADLRRQLAEALKSRDELSLKCNKLERELIELKENKTRPDEKVLQARQYQELERQFDEQEKLLSGYQRENERSLIELEATKVKMLKMSALLSKVYGPDWEDTISATNDGSPGGSMSKQHSLPHRLHSSPSTKNTTAIPSSPSEKLSLQLAQVQLLVQGMERRLVVREAELEDLHRQSKEEHLSLQESIAQFGSKPQSHPNLK